MLKRFGPARSRHRSRGQSLAEFALVFPVLMLILGGIIQFGVIFWGQNTLTQVARDTGRWAATQIFTPCDPNARGSLASQADAIAGTSSLIGYTAGQFSGTATTLALTPTPEGVGADWTKASGPGPTCPPTDNQTVWYVTIRLNHHVPIFFPFVPGNGTISSTALFRMEPVNP
jgi:Flp pilus assembly protein TadG